LKNNLILPAGALLDPAFDNLSAEEIYARLRKKNSESDGAGKPKPGDGNLDQQAAGPNASSPGETAAREEARPGGFGEVLDATDDQGNPASPAENSRQQHEWSVAAEQAVRMTKMCGQEPVNVERALQQTRESRQDWRAILRTFIAATTASDYRWTPPNRRYIGSGLYLPSVDRSGVGPIVIGVDTSGSIGQEELDQFAGEISAISDEVQPEAIHVVYCDAAVQASQLFTCGDPIQLEPKGGGGTDFRPVFQWVEENDIQPTCLLYLTDLCCTEYPDVPDYPVLWATDSRRTAPFGETICISVH
jgi:predicted metal-dependent peptidase